VRWGDRHQPVVVSLLLPCLGRYQARGAFFLAVGGAATVAALPLEETDARTVLEGEVFDEVALATRLFRVTTEGAVVFTGAAACGPWCRVSASSYAATRSGPVCLNSFPRLLSGLRVGGR
jgi:hypothetical protein